MSRILYSMNCMATDPEFGFGGPQGMLPSTRFVKKKGESELMTWYKGSGNKHDINSDGFNAEMQVHICDQRENPNDLNSKIIPKPFTVSCIKHMIDAVYYGLKSAREIAAKKKARVLVGDLVQINKRSIKTAPEECWQSGCNPTLSVKTMMFSEVLPDYKQQVISNGVPLGGHIHFITPPFKRTGNLSEDIEQGAAFVKFATAVALLPMILLGFNDTKIKRYKMLGLGNFRLPSHGGLEMKDFSGSALGSIAMFSLQYSLCRTAYCIFTQDRKLADVIASHSSFEAIEQAVMSGDVKKLRRLFAGVAKIVRANCSQHDNNPYMLGLLDVGRVCTSAKKLNMLEFMFDNPKFFVTDDIELGWGRFEIQNVQDKGLKSSFHSGYNRLITDNQTEFMSVVKGYIK